jgi:hypothetical protein
VNEFWDRTRDGARADCRPRIVRIDTPQGLGDRWVPRYRTLYRRCVAIVGVVCIAIGVASAAWILVGLGVAALAHAGPRGNAHSIEVDDRFVTYHAGVTDRQVRWADVECLELGRHTVGENTDDRILVTRWGRRPRPLKPGSSNAPIARDELTDILQWLQSWQARADIA